LAAESGALESAIGGAGAGTLWLEALIASASPFHVETAPAERARSMAASAGEDASRERTTIATIPAIASISDARTTSKLKRPARGATSGNS
jgi:hypothetical protein